MSVIDIIKEDITTLDMDVIVNSTNRRLREGSGGVCAAIFQKAGSEEMTKACMEIGRCKTGSAVITPGFSLPASFVIHAVGPKWEGGGHREQELLYTTYMHALTLAKENDLHSIGFPLISSGFHEFPVEEAWQCALQACHDFLQDNADYGTKIAFAIPEEKTFALGKRMLKGFTQEKGSRKAFACGAESMQFCSIPSTRMRNCKKPFTHTTPISRRQDLRAFAKS